MGLETKRLKTERLQIERLQICSLGRWADGSPVELAWPSPHILVSGTTGAGKSGWTSSIIGALADQPVAMFGIDMKSGLELAPWAGRFNHIAETPADATQLLVTFRAMLEQRNQLIKQHGAKSWRPPFGPGLLLVVDELAELGSMPADVLVAAIASDAGDRQSTAEVRRARDELAWRQALLGSLARLSRAAGVTIIAATQYPLANIVGSDLRSNLGGRISCRQTSREGIDIGLGAGWRETISPQDISPATPGVAHLLGVGGARRPRLAKAHHVTMHEIDRRVRATEPVKRLCADYLARFDVGV